MVDTLIHGFDVLGSHTYAEEGIYFPTITINHETATPVVLHDVGVVIDPSVNLTATKLTANEGQSLNNVVVGTFMIRAAKKMFRNIQLKLVGETVRNLLEPFRPTTAAALTFSEAIHIKIPVHTPQQLKLTMKHLSAALQRDKQLLPMYLLKAIATRSSVFKI